MFGLGRHSSYESNAAGRTSSSYAYIDQTMSGQRYLSPEDVYRLSGESGYFNAASFPQSRHESSTSSPRHSDITSLEHDSRHYSNPQSPYVEYPYTDLSRNDSGRDSVYGPSRRVTPPDQSNASSRHSPAGSYGGSAKTKDDQRSGSTKGSPKGNGKEKADDRHSDQRSSGAARHSSGHSSSSRKGMIGPTQQRLVSGVFIRY